MTNASVVNLFDNCFYDAENHELHWTNEDQATKAVLDCNNLASDVYVHWKDENGSWGEWKKLPIISRISINEGLRIAKMHDIALQDLGHMILDSDLNTILVES